jgi:hypothetical protein
MEKPRLFMNSKRMFVGSNKDICVFYSNDIASKQALGFFICPLLLIKYSFQELQ